MTKTVKVSNKVHGMLKTMQAEESGKAGRILSLTEVLERMLDRKEKEMERAKAIR